MINIDYGLLVDELLVGSYVIGRLGISHTLYQALEFILLGEFVVGLEHLRAENPELVHPNSRFLPHFLHGFRDLAKQVLEIFVNLTQNPISLLILGTENAFDLSV